VSEFLENRNQNLPNSPCSFLPPLSTSGLFTITMATSEVVSSETPILTNMHFAKAAQTQVQLPAGVSARGIKWEPTGVYYVCGSNNAIYVIKESLVVDRFAGQPGQEGSEDGDRLNEATFSFLYYMNGILIDSPGRMLVADSGSNRIRAIEGDLVSTFAGTTAGFLDGPKARCQFARPTSIARVLDKLYITDCDNHRIRIIDADGMVSSIGHGYRADPFANPERNSAPFHSPYFVSSGGKPNSIIVADRISGAGKIVSVSTKKRRVTSCRSLSSSPTQCLIYQQKEIVSVGNAIGPTDNKGIGPRCTNDHLCLCFDVNRRTGDLVAGVNGNFLVIWEDWFPQKVSSDRINAIDLSSSLQIESEPTDFGPTFVEIHHKASNTYFGIPKAILSIHRMQDSSLKSVEASSLPKKAIKAFFKLLCCVSPIFQQTTFAILSDYDQCAHAVRLTRILHLYHLVEIEHGPLVDCYLKLIGDLDADSLVDLLKVIWNECERDEWLLQRVAGATMPHWKRFMDRVGEWTDLAALDIKRYTILIAQLNGFPIPETPPNSPKNHLLSQLKRLREALAWRSRPFSTSKDLDVIAFTIAGHSEYIDVKRWVVEPQWPWFSKKLREQEKTDSSRVFELDDSFPRSLLLSLLGYFHTRNVDLSTFYPSDVLYAHTHGAKYGILRGADAQPLPLFELFIEDLHKL
jgi:hypothetical protein